MSKEKQIEEMADFLWKNTIIHTEDLCHDVAETLVIEGYRKQSEMLSEFLQMLENVCKYEERLSFQTIKDGIERQMALKGGADDGCKQ